MIQSGDIAGIGTLTDEEAQLLNFKVKEIVEATNEAEARVENLIMGGMVGFKGSIKQAIEGSAFQTHQMIHNRTDGGPRLSLGSTTGGGDRVVRSTRTA